MSDTEASTQEDLRREERPLFFKSLSIRLDKTLVAMSVRPNFRPSSAEGMLLETDDKKDLKHDPILLVTILALDEYYSGKKTNLGETGRSIIDHTLPVFRIEGVKERERDKNKKQYRVDEFGDEQLVSYDEKREVTPKHFASPPITGYAVSDPYLEYGEQLKKLDQEKLTNGLNSSLDFISKTRGRTIEGVWNLISNSLDMITFLSPKGLSGKPIDPVLPVAILALEAYYNQKERDELADLGRLLVNEVTALITKGTERESHINVLKGSEPYRKFEEGFRGHYTPVLAPA